MRGLRKSNQTNEHVNPNLPLSLGKGQTRLDQGKCKDNNNSLSFSMTCDADRRLSTNVFHQPGQHLDQLDEMASSLPMTSIIYFILKKSHTATIFCLRTCILHCVIVGRHHNLKDVAAIFFFPHEQFLESTSFAWVTGLSTNSLVLELEQYMRQEARTLPSDNK